MHQLTPLSLGGFRRGVSLKSSHLFSAPLWKRNCCGLQLDAKSLLVTTLENSRTAKKRANRITGLRANAKPVVRALFVDVETTLCLTRSVLADDLDELSVARALRVGDDDAVHRGFLPPNAAETNSYH